MKKIILALLVTLNFSIIASAVDMESGKTEDPKKADEALVTKDKANKASLEERRNALKAKHKKKMEEKAAAKAAKAATAKSLSADSTQASQDPLKDLKRDEKIQEMKEETAPKK